MTILDRIMNGITNVIGAIILIIVILDLASTLGLAGFGGLLIGLIIGSGMVTFKMESR